MGESLCLKDHLDIRSLFETPWYQETLVQGDLPSSIQFLARLQLLFVELRPTP